MNKGEHFFTKCLPCAVSFLYIFLCFILLRGYSFIFFEKAGEVEAVGEAAKRSDFLNGVLGHIAEQLTSTVEPTLPEEFHWGKAVFLLEKPP